MIFKADMHIHSCLSPCGGLDMSPSAIVHRAKACGLNALALTDHNSARNSAAFQEVCRVSGIACLFGMEINTTEEVHVLCYFDDLDAVMELDRVIYEHLPPVLNDPLRFGDQVVVNAQEEIEGELEKYLISAVDITLADLIVRIHAMNGLVIPSHVDRDAFSLSSQLGFVPADDFDALEITRYYELQNDPLRIRDRFPLVMNSDAHELDQLGAVFNSFELETFSVECLRTYFRHRRGYERSR